MLVDEADAVDGDWIERTRGNWVLTNLVAGLPYECHCRDYDAFHFQGNYDYDAHAQVYTGGADPLGSQGYASVIRNPSSSKMRPAMLKARGRFCLWAASNGN